MSTSSTLIDHALCNCQSDGYAGVYPNPITDQSPIFVVIDKCMRFCMEEFRSLYSTRNRSGHG